MYWTTPTTTIWREGTKGGATAPNRGKFLDVIKAGPSPGLLAYSGDDPVAWCRVMERRLLPGLANSRFFRTDLSIDGVWSLACFVVRPPYRGRGLTEILTRAAIAYVGERGGEILEVYPWDTNEKKATSTIYTGLASTFERLGFDVIQREAPHKPMMRLTVQRSA